MDKFSYSLGVVMANNLRNQGIEDFDPTDFAKGLEDSMKGNPLVVPLGEAGGIVQEGLRELAAKKYKGTIEAGAVFLAANA